jgi:hypothetical protein
MSRFLRLTFATSFAALSVSAAEVPSGATLIQLKNVELTRTLPGTEMGRVVRAHDQGSWSFGCDDTWSSDGGRARQSGRYVIRNDEFCIVSRGGQELSCYTLFRNTSGILFLKPVLKPGWAGGGPAQVILQRQVPIEKCQQIRSLSRKP